MGSKKVVAFSSAEAEMTVANPDIVSAIKRNYPGGSPSRYLERWVNGDVSLEFDEDDLMVMSSHGIHYKVLN